MKSVVCLLGFLSLDLIAQSTATQPQHGGFLSHDDRPSMPPALAPNSAMRAPVSAPPPFRLAARPDYLPIRLEPSRLTSRADIDAMNAWNASGMRPPQNGIVRKLPDSQRLSSTIEGGRWARVSSSESDVVFGFAVRVDEAASLRLHLERVALPEGTRLWVWGDAGPAREFGMELRGPDGDIWTPSVVGPTLYLEVRSIDGANLSMDATEVADILAVSSPALGECLVDASCISDASVPNLRNLGTGIGHLQYIKNGSSFVCTGGLLNDKPQAFSYMLTANHCFSTQSAASSLEIFWDYRSATCGGPAPSLSTLPRSNGSTLLATGTSSDFTFLLLNSVPPTVGSNRYYLGWDTRAIANGTVLRRLSHPFPNQRPAPEPLKYSESTAGTTVPPCRTGSYLYATMRLGGTFGGSSGAPVMTDGGYVVGQLFGGCGSADGCDYRASEADGSFAATYESIKQWINPPTPGSAPTAPSNLQAVARSGSVIEIGWLDNANNETEFRIERRSGTSGYLDIGSVVANTTATAITNLFQGTAYTFRVKARNASGDSGYSNEATATTTGGSSVCTQTSTALCLNSNRFKVETSWRTSDGRTGSGQAVRLTSDTGYFTFFDAANVEVVVKVLNGCFAPYNSYWVFASGLTNVSVETTVTDTKTGSVKRYSNPLNAPFQPVQDTSAFGTCP